MTLWDSITPWVGVVAAIMTTSSFLPQALRTWRTGSADDFSWFYLMLFGSGIILWALYGWLRQDVAIIVANAITLLLVSVIISVKFLQFIRQQNNQI